MGDKILIKRALISAACGLALAMAGSAQAANWLMLQGTEDPGASPRANVWGFVQAVYQKDFSSANAAGGFVPPKLLGPDLNSQSGFNINRARIGARGTGFPIDSHINYFLLMELGNNGTTHGGADYTFARMTDASITVNYIPGARIRTGLFKYPGAEEGLQAIHVFDYINFTEVTNGLLLERFPNKAYINAGTCYTPPGAPNGCTGNLSSPTQAQLQSGASMNAFNTPVGAFRDVGIQVFDAFDVGKDWEVSYAGMIGNGNGIEFDNSDGENDKYLYLSAEKEFGGKGPKAEGLKLFAWNQSGKRLLDNTDDTVDNPKSYKRDRAGLGVKYMKKPFRITAEYITAEGMIWVGPDKPNFYFTNNIAHGNGADAKANGWYLEGGWYVPNTKWELDARFDTMTRLKDRVNQHKFDKWTFGVQYHFNLKTRVTVNYEKRNFKCDSGVSPCTAPAPNTPNYNLDGVGNKLGVQLTAIF
jgi:hypothetical protein